MVTRWAVSLRAIKILHTVVWAVFVGCIVGLPIAAHEGHFGWALLCGGAVLGETLVLLLNGFRCPLTDLAARHTDDRRDNFDIYLPLWLARHNKTIFGTLFVLGLGYAIARWVLR